MEFPCIVGKLKEFAFENITVAFHCAVCIMCDPWWELICSNSIRWCGRGCCASITTAGCDHNFFKNYVALMEWMVLTTACPAVVCFHQLFNLKMLKTFFGTVQGQFVICQIVGSGWGEIGRCIHWTECALLTHNSSLSLWLSSMVWHDEIQFDHIGFMNALGQCEIGQV